MTPTEREEIIESALRAEFRAIWCWERDIVERPFGPDDTEYVGKFEARLHSLRETVRSDLRKLSDEELATIRDNPSDEFNIRASPLKPYITEDLGKLTDHRPPFIAYGYGHAYFSPDFTYWCQMPHLSLYEAVALSVGDDPERMTEEKIQSLKKSSTARAEMWAAHKFLLKRFDLLVRYFPITHYAFGSVSLRQLDDWFKEISLEIHPDFRAAIDKQLADSTSTVQPPVETLSSQERATLLKLIAAMACEQYGYDPTAKRSEVPSRISEDLDLVGLSMDPKTVRKWLRDASEFVDKSYWKR